MNKDIKAEPDKFIQIRDYWGEKYDKIVGDENGQMLRVGDRLLLAQMPDEIKKLEESKSPIIEKLKIGKMNYESKKRKSEDFEEEESPPPSKRINLSPPDEPEIDNQSVIFHNIFEKYICGYFKDNRDVMPSYEDGKFFIICNVCGKQLTVGHKMTKKDFPTFMNTNLKRHKCFRVTAEP